MTLHLIVVSENTSSARFLIKAAEERGIKVKVINANEVDFFNLPALEKGDLLFRLSGSPRAKRVEKLIISDDVAHFYKDSNYAISGRDSSYFYNKQAGLPVIKTIPLLPTKQSDISKHVDYLGGFPLVVKVMGRQDGVGVIQVDTIEGLKSLFDYVRIEKKTVLLRSFVQHAYYGRLVVIGDRVVASHRTYSSEDEFRTNARGNTDEKKEAIVFPEEVQKVAVAAVKSIGIEFGGVDILFSDNGEYYISEVNSPCAFNYTQKLTGIDIAGAIIDYLVIKANRSQLS
jgi:hypothetical protein